MTFGKIMKDLRRNANMTQEKLAEILNISPQAVSRWETDAAMPGHFPFAADCKSVSCYD